MTPQALATYRRLRTLGLPAAVLRKITIGVDGRPNFGALSDDEFDGLAREVRRRWPGYADPAQEGWGRTPPG